MNILELNGLKKYFATQKAVDDISMQVPRGSIFGNDGIRLTTMAIHTSQP